MAPQAYEEMDAGILPQVYEEIRAVEIQAEEIVKSRAARSTSEKPHRTGQDIGGVSGDPVSGKIESPGVMPSGAVPPVAMYPEALSPGTVPTETLSPGTISSGTAPPDTAFSEEHSSEILASKYAAGLAGEEKIQKTGLQAALEAREGEGKFRQESLREPSTDSQTATNADHPSETYLPYEALRQEAEEAGRKATLQKPGGPETPRQTAADQSTFKQRAAEGKERERTELYATGNKVAEHARYFAAIEQANTERIKVHTERIRDHTIPQVGAAFPGGKPVSSPLAGTGRKGSVFSGKRITGSSNMYQPKQSGIAGTIRNKLFALAGMAAGGMYTQIAAGEAISREVHGEEPVVRTLRHATGKIVRGTLSAATVKIRKGASIVFVKILPYVAGLIILMMAVILLLVMFSGTTITESNASGGKAINLSAEVEAYRPQVTQAAAKYGISAYVDLLLAVMMQESAGRGLDPMQASEGGFNTRFPREPGGITDPAYSIECGVQELKKALDVAGVTSPTDKTKIEICLQGYNFGYGYIYWMERHGYDTWSFETACAFAESTGWGLRMNPDSAAGPYRYGDQYYPEHVLRYYDFNATSPVPSGGLPIPLYYQWEYADVAYGEATVKETGCAPTAMSMVVSYLSGQTVTPREMVAWSGNRFYVGTIGTGWSFFSAAAAHFGVGNVTETGSAQEVLDALRAGRPVISSQSAGIFTSQGHFIVLRGVTAEGRILVNDPNDSEAKNFANRTFDFYSEIDATSKRYWIFDAKGD